jgi:hypothetical protein
VYNVTLSGFARLNETCYIPSIFARLRTMEDRKVTDKPIGSVHNAVRLATGCGTVRLQVTYTAWRALAEAYGTYRGRRYNGGNNTMFFDHDGSYSVYTFTMANSSQLKHGGYPKTLRDAAVAVISKWAASHRPEIRAIVRECKRQSGAEERRMRAVRRQFAA